MNTPHQTQTKRIVTRIGIVFGVLMLFLFFNSLFGSSLLDAGVPGPPWNLQRANGPRNVMSLEELRGNVVVLDFWSTTCPPCLKEIDVLKDIDREYGPKGVVVVGVSAGGESVNEISAFAKRKQINYPLVVDGTGITSNAYKVTALPTVYVLDPQGNVIAGHSGYWPKSGLKNAIDKAIGTN